MKKRFNKRKILAIAAVAFYVAITVVVFFFVGKPLIRFAREPIQFREWVAKRGVWGGLIYAGMVFFQVIIAIVPGEPLEIAGGYAFGAVGGALWCLLGASIGSMAVFMLVKRFGMRIVSVFFPREKVNSIRFLQASPKRDALLFLLMVVPGTPKDLLCYFAGLTQISWKKWLLISSVGRIPSIITSTIGGNAVGVSQFGAAAIAFGATAAISGIGLLIYRKIRRQHEKSITEENN